MTKVYSMWKVIGLERDAVGKREPCMGNNKCRNSGVPHASQTRPTKLLGPWGNNIEINHFMHYNFVMNNMHACNR